MAEPDKNFKTTKPIVIQTARKSFCILQNSQNSFSQALGSRRRSCILDRRTLPPSTNCTTYGNACSAAFKGTMHAFDWLLCEQNWQHYSQYTIMNGTLKTDICVGWWDLKLIACTTAIEVAFNPDFNIKLNSILIVVFHKIQYFFNN